MEKFTRHVTLVQAFFSTDFRQVDQVDLPKPWVFPLSFEKFLEDLVNFASKFVFSPTIHIYNYVFALSVTIAPHFRTYLLCFLHWFSPDLPKPWVLCLSFEFFPWVLSIFILEFFWRGRKKPKYNPPLGCDILQWDQAWPGTKLIVWTWPGPLVHS